MSIAPRGWSRSIHRRGTDHAGNILVGMPSGQERYGIWGGLTERERLQAWAGHHRPIG